jgi:DNA-binding XRE family transcriptional regulator
MKNNTIQLSKNIKKHRLMKDMSQNELALRIGVSHQAQNGRLVKISQIL